MTLEEAKVAINNLPFPEVNEGDIAWYPGGKPGTDMDIALGMMEPNGFPIQNDKYLKSII